MKNKNDDISFLSSCIDYVNNLDNTEIEKIKKIYKEEKEKDIDNCFKIILPEKQKKG